MLTCEINLCLRDEYFCSPVIFIKDENGGSVPFILPEDMEIDMAKKVCEKLKADIEAEYTNLDDVRKLIYQKHLLLDLVLTLR